MVLHFIERNKIRMTIRLFFYKSLSVSYYFAYSVLVDSYRAVTNPARKKARSKARSFGSLGRMSILSTNSAWKSGVAAKTAPKRNHSRATSSIRMGPFSSLAERDTAVIAPRSLCPFLSVPHFVMSL